MRALADIADRCAQETERFFQGQSYDPQYCFELFRRAILEHDQSAWETIHARYQSLVAGWVKQHPAFESSGEEVPYFVNRAFEKIWVALTPDKFGRFSDLSSLLNAHKSIHTICPCGYWDDPTLRQPHLLAGDGHPLSEAHKRSGP